MTELRLEYRFRDKLPSLPPDEANTQAELEIWAGKECVTEAVEAESKRANNHINVALYPLAHWLVLNWWHIFHEGTDTPPPTDRDTDDFHRRHNLQFANDGYAWPDIDILRVGDAIRIKWKATPNPNYNFPVRFINSGEADVPVAQAEAQFRGLVRATTEHLSKAGMADDPLVLEWERLKETSEEEKQFCQVAAALGYNPYAIEQETADNIIEAFNPFPESWHPELAQVFHHQHFAKEAQQLSGWFAKTGLGSPTLAKLRAELKMKKNPVPHERGYKAATLVWKTLNEKPRLIAGGVDVLLSLLNLSETEARDAVEDNAFEASGIRGAFKLNKNQQPIFATARGREDNRKFAFARVLGHYLLYGNEAKGVVTNLYTAQQQTGRAFAAELLAPHEALRHELRLGRKPEQIAKTYQLPEWVLMHQMDNFSLQAA